MNHQEHKMVGITTGISSPAEIIQNSVYDVLHQSMRHVKNTSNIIIQFQPTDTHQGDSHTLLSSSLPSLPSLPITSHSMSSQTCDSLHHTDSLSSTLSKPTSNAKKRRKSMWNAAHTISPKSPIAISHTTTTNQSSSHQHNSNDMDGFLKNGINMNSARGSQGIQSSCITCNQSSLQCPKHRAHLSMSVPIYNILYLDHVIKILNLVCYWCSRLILDDDCLEKKHDPSLINHYHHNIHSAHLSKKHLQHLEKLTQDTLSSVKKCAHCHGPQPSYQLGPDTTIEINWTSIRTWSNTPIMMHTYAQSRHLSTLRPLYLYYQHHDQHVPHNTPPEIKAYHTPIVSETLQPLFNLIDCNHKNSYINHPQSIYNPALSHVQLDMEVMFYYTMHRLHRRQTMLFNTQLRSLLFSRVFTPLDAREILSHMTRKDITRLGMHHDRAHPCWMIFSIFPIPSSTLSPNWMMTRDGEVKSSDKIAKKVEDIVATHQTLHTWLNTHRSACLLPCSTSLNILELMTRSFDMNHYEHTTLYFHHVLDHIKNYGYLDSELRPGVVENIPTSIIHEGCFMPLHADDRGLQQWPIVFLEQWMMLQDVVSCYLDASLVKRRASKIIPSTLFNANHEEHDVNGGNDDNDGNDDNNNVKVDDVYRSFEHALDPALKISTIVDKPYIPVTQNHPQAHVYDLNSSTKDTSNTLCLSSVDNTIPCIQNLEPIKMRTLMDDDPLHPNTILHPFVTNEFHIRDIGEVNCCTLSSTISPSLSRPPNSLCHTLSPLALQDQFHPLDLRHELVNYPSWITHPRISNSKYTNTTSTSDLGLAELMGSKNGLLRSWLCSKTLNNSGMAPIVPQVNAHVDINTIELPSAAMKILTLKEVVTLSNRTRLQQCVNLGYHHPCGASKVVHVDGTMIHLDRIPNASSLPSSSSSSFSSSSSSSSLSSLSKSNHDQSFYRVTLAIGWSVYRYLQPHDWIITNRAPILHQGNIMAHQVMENNSSNPTLRSVELTKTHHTIPSFNQISHHFNDQLHAITHASNTTSLYHADFDGDTEAMVVPQDTITQSECKHLLAPHHAIQTNKNYGVQLYLIADHVIALAQLTQKDVFFNQQQSYYLLSSYASSLHHAHKKLSLPIPCILKPERRWSGKQLVSMLFPTQLHYTCTPIRPLDDELKTNNDCKNTMHRNASCNDDYFRSNGGEEQKDIDIDVDLQIIIRQGLLLQGQLCSFTLGKTQQYHSNSLLSQIVHEYGEMVTMHFINNMTELSRLFAVRWLFSIPADNYLHPPTFPLSIYTIHHTPLLFAIHYGGKSQWQSLMQIAWQFPHSRLDHHHHHYHYHYHHHHHHGHHHGHQYLPSPRLKPIISHDSPHNLIQGHTSLTDRIHYYDCLARNVSLSLTQTPAIGHLQHILESQLQSCMVNYNRQVRDASGKLIQLIYGGDGHSVNRMNIIEIPYAHLNTLLQPSTASYPSKSIHTSLNSDQHQYDEQYYIDRENMELQRMMDMYQSHQSRGAFRLNLNPRYINPHVLYIQTSVDIRQWLVELELNSDDITSCHAQTNISDKHQTPPPPTLMTMADFSYIVDRLCKAIGDFAGRFTTPYALLLLIRYTFRFQNPLYAFAKITHQQLLDVTRKIFMAYVRSWCDAGTDVGSLAAQSVCEPWALATTKTTSFSKQYTQPHPSSQFTFNNKKIFDQTSDHDHHHQNAYQPYHLSQALNMGHAHHDKHVIQTLSHMLTSSSSINHSSMHIALHPDWVSCMEQAYVVGRSMMECKLSDLIALTRVFLLSRTSPLISHAIHRYRLPTHDSQFSKIHRTIYQFKPRQMIKMDECVAVTFDLSTLSMKRLNMDIKDVAIGIQTWMVQGQHVHIINHHTLLFWDDAYAHVCRMNDSADNHFKLMESLFYQCQQLVLEFIIPRITISGIKQLVNFKVIPPKKLVMKYHDDDVGQSLAVPTPTQCVTSTVDVHYQSVATSAASTTSASSSSRSPCHSHTHDNHDNDSSNSIVSPSHLLHTSPPDLQKSSMQMSVQMNNHTSTIQQPLNHNPMTTHDVWMLETTGSNLAEVMAHPAVLDTMTTTNDFNQVKSVLGGYAQRNALLSALPNLVQSENDAHLQMRHWALIADYMTWSGSIKPMNRYHMESQHNHPFISRSLFENNVQSTVKSALAAEVAPSHMGILTATLVGDLPKVGTGLVRILKQDTSPN